MSTRDATLFRAGGMPRDRQGPHERRPWCVLWPCLWLWHMVAHVTRCPPSHRCPAGFWLGSGNAAPGSQTSEPSCFGRVTAQLSKAAKIEKLIFSPSACSRRGKRQVLHSLQSPQPGGRGTVLAQGHPAAMGASTGCCSGYGTAWAKSRLVKRHRVLLPRGDRSPPSEPAHCGLFNSAL